MKTDARQSPLAIGNIDAFYTGQAMVDRFERRTPGALA